MTPPRSSRLLMVSRPVGSSSRAARIQDTGAAGAGEGTAGDAFPAPAGYTGGSAAPRKPTDRPTMPETFPCPNPVCTQVFSPEDVRGVSSLTCPKCGTVFNFGTGGAP